MLANYDHPLTICQGSPGREFYGTLAQRFIGIASKLDVVGIRMPVDSPDVRLLTI